MIFVWHKCAFELKILIIDTRITAFHDYLVVAGPVGRPKLNAVAVAAVVAWAPYGGALNEWTPMLVVAGGGAAAAAVGTAVGATAAVGVPKPKDGCCVDVAPNAKPVLAVVCGVPNENPDILTLFHLFHWWTKTKLFCNIHNFSRGFY